MKRLARMVAAGFDTAGFIVGYLLILAGVAMLTIPGALILAGVLLCLMMGAVALARTAEKRRGSS